MATITMTFAKYINVSVQVGDTAYYCVVTSGVGATPVEMGTVTAVTATTITCNIGVGTTRPTTSNFIMFSKDNKANLSSLSGYYAEVEMKNDETSAVELYAVGSEIFTSSK
jgi:hypothetical protein